MIFGVKTLLYLVRKRYFLLLKIWCENDNIWCENDISSIASGDEFNLREDLAWTYFHISKYNYQFYLSAQYYAAEQLFLFYVMLIGLLLSINQNLRLENCTSTSNNESMTVFCPSPTPKSNSKVHI